LRWYLIKQSGLFLLSSEDFINLSPFHRHRNIVVAEDAGLNDLHLVCCACAYPEKYHPIRLSGISVMAQELARNSTRFMSSGRQNCDGNIFLIYSGYRRVNTISSGPVAKK
jgi:hypothetical protein